jgi:hypothetical protein
MRRQMPASTVRPPRALTALALAASLGLAGCGVLTPSPTPIASGGATPTPGASRPGSSDPTATPRPSADLPLSLDLPGSVDSRPIQVEVEPRIPADASGELIVTVINLSGSMVDELVLRWPTGLGTVVFLAPFEPSQQRIREGGPILNQDWTKWVIGPGESGEPAGTTSVGWGPLLAGATLTIPLVAERRGDGPVAFDLQILAGESILTFDAQLAELRVALP